MTASPALLIGCFCKSCGLRTHWAVPVRVQVRLFLAQIPCNRCGQSALREMRSDLAKLEENVDGGAIGPLLKGAR